MTAPRISRLTAEHRPDALGVGVGHPAPLLVHGDRHPRLDAGRVRAAVTAADGTESLDRCRRLRLSRVLVAWPASAARDRANARTVQVRVVGNDGSESPWSEPLTVEAGLLDADDWQATFVGPAWDEDLESPQPVPVPAAVVRGPVARDAGAPLRDRARRVRARVERPPRRRPRARARVDELPPPAPLRHVRRHRRGAAGRQRHRRGARRRVVPRRARREPATEPLRRPTRPPLPTRAHPRRRYDHGRGERRRSGARRPARSVATGLYEGETYDARAELTGWSEPGFDDPTWSAVTTVEHDLATLTAPSAPPIRVTERITPVGDPDVAERPHDRRLRPEPGRRDRAHRGRTSRNRDHHSPRRGAPGRRALHRAAAASAIATDRYTLRGDGPETWHPRFTFHGFRFAEITGWPGELTHRRPDRTRRAHRHDAHRLVRVLGRPHQPAARERRLGHAGQLRRHPHRLPPARRTPRLDRRHRGVRTHGHVPLRLRRPPGVVAARPRRGTARRRHRAVGDPRLPRLAAPGRGVGRRGRHRARDAATSASATVGGARAAVRQHAGVGGPRARARRRRPPVDRWLPVRRLARSHRRRRRCVRPAHRPGPARDRGDDPLARPRSRRAAELLGRGDDDTLLRRPCARDARAAFAREYVTPSGRLASDAQTAYALAIAYALLAMPRSNGRTRASDCERSCSRAS